MGYPKQVYRRANAELARRKDAARELTAARAKEIAEKIPETERIRAELAQTAASVTRLVITSPQKAEEELQQLRERSLALQERRAQLLKQAGYPADYLCEQTACPNCGGSGYTGFEMCECFRELLQKEARAELNAVSQAEKCTFDTFSLDMYPNAPANASARAHMAAVLEECRKYSAEFTSASQSLLMIGHTGLGKTHLSLAIAAGVTAKGFGVVYTPVQKLMDRLESAKFSYAAEAKEQYAADIENATCCDLLVLDDLGAEFTTQFSASALYNIVNTRLVESRPTIISTNLEPAEIEAKYSQRMLSRLMGSYRALKFMGKDIRFVKKLNTNLK